MNSLNKYLLLCCCLLAAMPGFALPRIERRIVIEHGQYYYITVDDETQMATLHEGNAFIAFPKIRSTPLPLGREAMEPYLPLAFDVRGEQLTAINWILHPMNSRYEAIRRIDLQDWKKRNPISPDAAALLEASMEQPSVAPFVPWQFMKARNNVLEHTFFDLAVVSDSEMVIAVCNQGDLMLWIWNGRQWRHSIDIPVPFREYFALLVSGDHIAVSGPDGDLYAYDLKRNSWKQPFPQASFSLEKNVIVTDKNRGRVYILATEYLEPGPESLEHLLEKHGRQLEF